MSIYMSISKIHLEIRCQYSSINYHPNLTPLELVSGALFSSSQKSIECIAPSALCLPIFSLNICIFFLNICIFLENICLFSEIHKILFSKSKKYLSTSKNTCQYSSKNTCQYSPINYHLNLTSQTQQKYLSIFIHKLPSKSNLSNTTKIPVNIPPC